MTTQSLERVYRITADATQAINQLDRIAKSTGNIDAKMSNLGNSIQSAFGRLAAVAGVATFGKSVLTASENVANLQGSFKALLGDGDRAADMLERVYATVANTGADITTVSQAVQRLAIGLKEVGATNAQIQTIAENFIKLGRIGGSSIQDINGALLQFNQGLASGRLQGDELRSIMERVPGIIQLIAKEMGVSAGEVKKLGSEGKITADIMSNALLKATTQINKDFSELPVTFEQSMNILKATWGKFLVEVGKTSGIMDQVGLSVKYIDNGLKNVNSSMSTISLVGQSLKVVFQTVAIVASDLAFIVTGITSDISRLVSVIRLALSGDLKAIPELWSNVSQEQAKARQELDLYQGQILGTIEPVKKLGAELEGAAGSIGLITSKIKGELNPALKELQDLGQKRFLAIEGIALLEKLSPEAISRLGVTVKDVADAIKKLQEVVDPSDAALRKFATSVQDAVNPANELVVYLAQLEMALAKGYISWNTYADATLKAMEKMEPEKLQETKDALDEIGVAIGNSIAQGVNGLVDAFFEADKSFQQFASNFLTQIGKMIIQMLILAQIKKSLAGTGVGAALGIFANGGSFPGSTTLPKNSVLTEPTFFKFANGGTFGGGGSRMGVAGEAGPEAVIPLKRNNAGKLGVGASPVNVTINNNMSETANVQIQETNKADGTREISVLIEKRVKELFANGAMDKQMRGAYGLSRTPA
jgi:tape measure domain-containing protein